MRDAAAELLIGGVSVLPVGTTWVVRSGGETALFAAYGGKQS